MTTEGSREEFQGLVLAVMSRFFAQVSEPFPIALADRVAAQLGELIAERGLPRPLADGEVGAPGGMSGEERAPLLARVMAGVDHPMLREIATQLVKACFYPEFRQCRDSFREVTRDGACRRQEIERVRGRISGTHCVDCPHWVALTPQQHRAYLEREWRNDPREFALHQELFLPEDFRALRRWLHAAARRSCAEQ